jgi:hypothetical protein
LWAPAWWSAVVVSSILCWFSCRVLAGQHPHCVWVIFSPSASWAFFGGQVSTLPPGVGVMVQVVVGWYVPSHRGLVSECLPPLVSHGGWSWAPTSLWSAPSHFGSCGQCPQLVSALPPSGWLVSALHRWLVMGVVSAFPLGVGLSVPSHRGVSVWVPDSK